MIKHQDQNQPGEKEIYFVYIFVSQTIMKGAQKRNSRREPRGSSWSRSNGRMMIINLLTVACSAGFLIAPRTISPGVALLTVSWAFSYQSSIKKMLDTFTYRPTSWRHFLSWDSFFLNDFRLCQGNSQHSWLHQHSNHSNHFIDTNNIMLCPLHHLFFNNV